MPAWLVFLLSAAAIVAAGVRLSRDGDVIADRTGLGGAWVGAILLAGATSLPEATTNLFAVRQGNSDLAIGNLFGACMANMLVLALADLATTRVRVLTRVAINQVLLGLLAILLVGIAAVAIVTHLGISFLNLGWGPLMIAAVYVAGMRLLHVNREGPPFQRAENAAEPAETRGPELRRAAVGFAGAAAVIFVAAGHLAASADRLAEQFGISEGFAGLVLLALVTTLPELVVTIASVRTEAYDLAVGNLFGSNCFNMAILFLLDLADGPGPILAGAQPSLLVAALFAILLMAQALLGVLNKSEHRLWYLEPDAVFLILTYGGGLYLTYRMGR